MSGMYDAAPLNVPSTPGMSYFGRHLPFIDVAAEERKTFNMHADLALAGYSPKRSRAERDEDDE